MAGPAQRTKSEDQPNFEIQVEDGRGLLLLKPRTFFGWLKIVELELAIPNVRFPLDITGGMAQFQSQACQIQRAHLRVEAASMRGYVDARAARLKQAGFENVSARFAPGAVTLSASARVGERVADFTARASVEQDGHDVRLVLHEARLYGYLRRPAPLLAHDLLCVLVGATRAADGDVEVPREHGLAEVLVRPLELFLGRVLPQAGWKLPHMAEVRVESAALDESGAEVRYGPSGPPLPPEPAPRWRAGDQALLSADLNGALARYREALAKDPEPARVLVERALAILCARDATLREAVELADSAMRRWPDFVPGELARAQAAAARGRDEEAALHLARVVELAGDDDEVAVRAALTAARLAPDPARAAALYELVLARRPDDTEASNALAALHLAAGRFPEVLKVLGGLVAASTSDRHRAAALVRIAEVLAAKQADFAAARSELERAVEYDPENRRAWELLARTRAELGDAAGAVEALDEAERLPATTDDAVSRALTLVRAAAELERTGDLDGARLLYQRALALTPRDAQVLEKAAELAVARGDPREAMLFLPVLIEASPADPWRRRRAQAELFRLLIETGDVERARKLLDEAQLDPDAELLTRLAALEHAAGRPEAAIQALARAARLAAPERAPAIELERGRLCEAVGRVAEARAAFESTYARAGEGTVALAAARELSRLAQAAGDGVAEARWLDVLLVGRAGVAPTDDRARLLYRRAQLALAAGEPGSARRLLDELGASGGAPARRLYADVLGAEDDAAGRAAILESLADEAAGPNEQSALLVEAARARLAAGQLAAAESVARRAQALAPSVEAVRALLADIAFQGRIWDDAAVLYRELAPLAVGEERVEWTRRLAVALERLGRGQEALVAYRQAVAADDAAGPALTATWCGLAELEERAGDYAAAARWLKAAADDPRTGEPPGARAELLRRAAALWHRRVGAVAEAQTALEAALALEPADRATLDAIEALHAEAGDEEGLTRLAARKVDAARALHLAELERDPRSLSALRFLAADAVREGDETAIDYTTRLAEAAEGEERQGALIALARLEHQVGRAADAERHYWAAIDLAAPPVQLELLAGLEELFERAGRWGELAMVLAHRMQLVPKEAQPELEARRLAVLLDGMQNAEAAADGCRRALTEWPGDERFLSLFLRAARTLVGGPGIAMAAELALIPGASPDALELVSDKATAEGKNPHIANALSRVFSAHAAALAGSDRLLDRAGGRLFVALQVAASASESWSALALGLKAAATVAPEARAAGEWLRAAGRLYREQLGDGATAADAFERALEYDPDSATLEELESLLRGRGELPRLGAAWERYLGTLDGERRVPALEKLAALAAEQGDEARAARYRDEARTSAPTPEALRVKSAALGRAVSPPPVEPGLAEHIRVLEAQLASLPIERLAQIRAARLELVALKRRAGQTAQARALLETVLSEEPTNAVGLGVLVEMELKEGRFADAATALERLAQLASDRAGQAECFFRAGEVARLHLGDAERAEGSYLKAIDAEPRHVPTLRRLVTQYFAAGDPRAVLEMADALADESALLDDASGADLWAQVAVAAGAAGEPTRLVSLARALAKTGAAPLARALAQATWAPVAARIEAAELLERASGPAVAGVRAELERLGAADLARVLRS